MKLSGSKDNLFADAILNELRQSGPIPVPEDEPVEDKAFVNCLQSLMKNMPKKKN